MHQGKIDRDQLFLELRQGEKSALHTLPVIEPNQVLILRINEFLEIEPEEADALFDAQNADWT